MKISVITMQSVYNYGSALQAYATDTFLKKKGHEVEFVDYYPKRMRNYGSLKQLYIDAKPFHKKVWKCIAVSLVKYPSMKALKKVFLPFGEKYIPKSKMYNSLEELKSNPPMADVYCTGSDQVWNDYLEGRFDKAYFLDYAPADKKRIAYSASFGREDISDDELKPVKDLLEKYSAISVREDSGLEMLENIDVPFKQCVLDPTFMLSKEEWNKLAEPVKESGYILVYKLHEDSIASEVALEMGRKMNKPVIRISTDYFKRIKGGKTIVAPKVQEFVSYIANADFVVTDSFHATAFSISFNVPFVSVKWSMFNDRIGTVLRKFKLEDRHISTVDEAVKVSENKIDFDKVNALVEAEREKTEEFLDKALS